MALNAMGLGFIFSARDMASAKLDKLTGKFNKLDTTTEASAARMTANLTKVKQGFAGFAVGAAGLLAAVKIAGPAGEFEQAIARVGAISRASAADLQMLEKAATEAGLATQFSPKEAADGLGVLAAQGFNATESARALKPALDLAAGGSIGVAEAAKAMSSSLKVFGLEADDAALAADKLLRISNATALQASDLSLALGAVGRGASATKQSLDEMLPAMGLVKNTGVDASVAASSVSSALLFMAKNAKKFSELGVRVTDAQGRFRPFLDIVLETNKGLERYTDEATRTKKATELFGRFGLTAFSAISTQVSKGIKDSQGQIVRGTEAINMLRDSMQNAGGAAKEFRDRLLNNFAGQKQLLSGIFDTFVIEAGKPFAQVLRPVVQSIAAMLQGLIKVIQLIPAPLKKVIAGFFLAGMALVAVVGAVVALKAAFAILIPMALSAASALAPVALVALKVVAVVGAVAGAVIGLGKVLGVSMEDIREVGSKIALFWDGLVQLFRDGYFSGAVMREMDKAEGIKGFAITLFRIGSRIRSFFEGLAGGFAEAFGPGVDAIIEAGSELKFALLELWGVFADAFGGIGKTFADFLPVGDSFRGFGALIGAVLGGVVRLFAWGVRIVINAVTKIVEGITWLARKAKEIGGAVVDAFGWIGGAIVDAFRPVAGSVRGLLEPIGDFFMSMANGIMAGLTELKDFSIGILREIPDWALPEEVVKLKQIETGEERRNREASEAQFAALPAAVQERHRARVAEAAGSPLDLIRAVSELGREVASLREAQRAPASVNLDGQKVGEILNTSAQDAADRAFVPVQVAT